MAYMNQEKKAKIKAVLEVVFAKHGLKGSLKVQNHSTIVCTLFRGKVDFIGGAIDNRTKEYLKEGSSINLYHYEKAFSPEIIPVIAEIHAALNLDNHDRSDIMTDYFDVGHYVTLNIGAYNKPYQLTA
jgi:hypothetical protein